MPTLVGVVAGLTPLLLVPFDDGGVPRALLPDLAEFSRGGDRGFFRDSDDPIAPSTFDAVELDDRGFITASAMM